MLSTEYLGMMNDNIHSHQVYITYTDDVTLFTF